MNHSSMPIGFILKRDIGKSFSSAEYFVLKHLEMFPGINLDQLHEQFLNFQLLSEAEIAKEARANINLSEEHPYHVDVL